MNRLALFARPVEGGQVKSRLSPALPPELARALYRGMLEDALAALRSSTLAEERAVHWAEPGVGLEVPGAASRSQSSGDLGERLALAFSELLAGPEDRAVIFGADCPALDGAALDRALRALDSADLVLAPSRDGGFALIGLRSTTPGLFSGVAWSTERTLAEVRERARSLGLEVALLDPLDDVDTPEDLCRLVALVVCDATAAGPSTRSALRLLGLLPA